ncbi:TPA: flagellar hook-length control protein FliK [Morganella morganii]|nr:flagellar hook-length control protein FliK [Morganella morganii]HAT1525566.1 flagellar hook-length control protein FliK [Morganella morganii]HDF2363066.1 flagellar hook-length control protein FliK [Morganella morganii]HDF2422246.1 flagellar hook-length control protein FliK [Morganella morganii]
MDVNAGTKAVSSADNALNKQESPRAEDAQATVLPFQAVMDAQQPRPDKPAQAVHAVKQTRNDTAAHKQAADSKTAAAQEKQTGADTMAQLNFSRRLAGDTASPALDAKLLTTGDDTPALPQTESEADNALLALLKERLTGRESRTADKAAADTKLHIDDSGKNSAKTTELPEEVLTKTRDKPLLTDENNDARTLFVDDKSKPRVDQPRFSLTDTQKPDQKALPDDFLPLNKKSADTSVPLSLASAADNSADNSKSAFSIKTESSAFQTITAPGSHTAVQSPALMPAAAQSTAAQTNAPVAQPAMQLTAQPGSELWQQQVSQNMIYFSRQGLQQAQLRLHPEELGSLNIHLKIEDNQAVMHFVSPHSHVRAAMESMMPVLRNALQESGIHLAQSSVGQEYHGNQQGSGDDRHSGGSADGIASAGSISGVNISTDNLVRPAALHDARVRGGIDTFA